MSHRNEATAALKALSVATDACRECPLGAHATQCEKLCVTNAAKHFKYELRGKRRMHKTPGQREAQACHHWLESGMELMQPRACIALGATAARSLLGRPGAVLKERGQWIEEAQTGRRLLVTLLPSVLLRGDPLQREAAWEAWLEDLSAASELMKKAGAKRPAERQAAAEKSAARPAASHARRRVRMVME